MSAEQMKDVIRVLVEQEDKKKPYSNSKLTELLKDRGIRISRRAVAKYRDRREKT